MGELILGLALPVIGTTVGAAFVFFIKDKIPGYVQKALLGFASGVMIAASVWSLLIPSMNMVETEGVMSVIPAAIGFLLGMGFLLLLDEIIPHLHIDNNSPEGPKTKLSRTAMLTFAVALHNLPEGHIEGYQFVDYKEHAISSGSDTQAVCYIQLKSPEGSDIFGVGKSHNINRASLRAILCAINRSVAK